MKKNSRSFLFFIVLAAFTLVSCQESSKYYITIVDGLEEIDYSQFVGYGFAIRGWANGKPIYYVVSDSDSCRIPVLFCWSAMKQRDSISMKMYENRSTCNPDTAGMLKLISKVRHMNFSYLSVDSSGMVFVNVTDIGAKPNLIKSANGIELCRRVPERCEYIDRNWYLIKY